MVKGKAECRRVAIALRMAGCSGRRKLSGSPDHCGQGISYGDVRGCDGDFQKVKNRGVMP